MSRLVAPRWEPSTAPPGNRTRRPSLREVRLVGTARPSEPRPDPLRPGETIRKAGRRYRVASSHRAAEPDPRRYAHLTPLSPDPIGT